MLKEELIKELNKLPDGSEIYIRYGSVNTVSDIEFEYCEDYETDEGIGEFYLIVSNGENIQNAHLDDYDEDEDDDTPSFVDKTIQIEIDSDLFFNEVSMDCTSWSYNLYDLEQNKPVYDYIKEYHAEELQALKDGKADYIEVYRDVF